MHRDLKPDNILMIGGQAVLADFGLASRVDTPGNMDDHVVTASYRAPELVLGARRYGPEVDVWSLGCIILEMIGGHRPMPGHIHPVPGSDEERISLISNVMRANPPTDEEWGYLRTLPRGTLLSSIRRPKSTSRLWCLDRDLPDEVKDVLRRCLAYIPDRRASVCELLEVRSPNRPHALVCNQHLPIPMPRCPFSRSDMSPVDRIW